nr:ribonuclease H-like domain, reverse transcriptase, RNA-dependent DNA polymerase [Tanacetum cinerariifolium]
MIAYLSKSDVSKGFNQIIDFLNGSSIKYALIVNPNIYVSCIKQFWTTVAVKKVNDVTRLQALVDKKKVVVTKATIRDALCLDDVEGVECLANEEIFAELARIGYEKPSTKLTFYKAFFSIQWKFLIHTILQCMSAKRTSCNEFSSSMASAVICLSTGKGFFGVETPLFKGMLVAQEVDEGADKVPVGDVNTAEGAAAGDVSTANDNDEVPTADEEPSIPSPTPPTPPPQPSQDIPSTSQVQPTLTQSPQAQPPPPQQQQQQQQPSQDLGIHMDLLYTFLDTCTTLTRRVEHLEQDKIAQALKITKLKQRGRMIAEIDADVVLEEDKDKDVAADMVKDEDKIEQAEVQKVVDVVTTAKIITKVVTATSDIITATSTTITIVEAQVLTVITTTAPSRLTAAPRKRKGVVIRDPEESTTSIIIPAETKSKDKGKGILVEEPKPLKKQAQIEQDEAFARELKAELNKNIDWDKVINHVHKKAKEDPVVKRYQALKKKPQTEAQARKNMIIYLKNVAGFKMDYFKGMSYDDILPIFEVKFNTNMAFLQKTKEQIEEEDSRALKRLNETPAEKAAKKHKLDEEVEELKRHLQIVPNKEDDVYTEATSLALKIPVVDYEIYNEHNKPYYKIKRANGSHQLEMFQKPDIHAQIWKNQRSVHGQAKVKSWKLLESCGVQIITFTTTHLILLVERKYPLTKFTLNQMINNVRLKVKEESEVSLEFLRSLKIVMENLNHLNDPNVPEEWDVPLGGEVDEPMVDLEFNEEEVGGPSTAAIEGPSFPLPAPGLPVPPTTIEDLSTRSGKLEYRHGVLMRKMEEVSDAEVANSIAIGEIHPRATIVEEQVQVMESQAVQVTALYGTELQNHQLQTRVAEMESHVGILMSYMLCMEERLTVLEKRLPRPPLGPSSHFLSFLT